MVAQDRPTGIPLIELDPIWLRCVSATDSKHVDDRDEAHGIIFDCPKCGNHRVRVWFTGTPHDDAWPTPRWAATGTGFEDLTLHPSINIGSGCCWHGWVQGGIVSLGLDWR